MTGPFQPGQPVFFMQQNATSLAAYAAVAVAVAVAAAAAAAVAADETFRNASFRGWADSTCKSHPSGASRTAWSAAATATKTIVQVSAATGTSRCSANATTRTFSTSHLHTSNVDTIQPNSAFTYWPTNNCMKYKNSLLKQWRNILITQKILNKNAFSGNTVVLREFICYFGVPLYFKSLESSILQLCCM